jgi:hypothetical protein
MSSGSTALEELLADFFGVRFGGERTSNKIGHHNLYLFSRVSG